MFSRDNVFYGRVKGERRYRDFSLLFISSGNRMYIHKYFGKEKIPRHSIVKMEHYEISEESNPPEIIADTLEVISIPRKPLPIHKDSSLKKRIQYRFIDLRNTKVRNIFEIKSNMLKSIRDFFYERDFIEVYSPKIVQGSTEGPVDHFVIDYYGTPAELSISNVLYHQMLISGDMWKIFEISPLFRAQQSPRKDQIVEFNMLDYSIAYTTRDEMIELTKELLQHVHGYIQEENSRELKENGIVLPDVTKFDIVTYTEYNDLLKELVGRELNWDSHQIPPWAAKAIGEEFTDFFFLIDFPHHTKPFYIKRSEKDERFCQNFELHSTNLANICGGGAIETDPDKIYENLVLRGLNPKNFNYYLESLEYGTPEFSLNGMGIDRLCMALLGIENIREVVLFPRDRRILYP